MSSEIEQLEAWLQEQEAAARATGWTAAEIAEKLGMSTKAARQAIRAAIEAGHWECGGERAGRRIDGVRHWKPVYRPVPKTKGAK
jgi:hypothetical protein